MVICLERGADLHTAQLIPPLPLPLTVSCFNKIQIGFTFLVPAHPGSPGKRAAKRVCVCVCVSTRYDDDDWLNVALHVYAVGCSPRFSIKFTGCCCRSAEQRRQKSEAAQGSTRLRPQHELQAQLQAQATRRRRRKSVLSGAVVSLLIKINQIKYYFHGG